MGPLLWPFPGNEAPKFFFFWAPQSGAFGWGQNVDVEKVYVLFLFPIIVGLTKVSLESGGGDAGGGAAGRRPRGVWPEKVERTSLPFSVRKTQ